jgi:hypothetical protein
MRHPFDGVLIPEQTLAPQPGRQSRLMCTLAGGAALIGLWLTPTANAQTVVSGAAVAPAGDAPRAAPITTPAKPPAAINRPGMATTMAVGEEGGNVTTLALNETGAAPAPANPPRANPPRATTMALDEEGAVATTMMVGEEGGVVRPVNPPQVTTDALGEEGGRVTTDALGEEGGANRPPDPPRATTEALGEEGGTTRALGEEGGATRPNPPTTKPDTRPATTPTTYPAATAAEIADLIRQLGAESYTAREAALKRLIEIGPAARSALETAKNDRDAEISSRAAYALQTIR